MAITLQHPQSGPRRGNKVIQRLTCAGDDDRCVFVIECRYFVPEDQREFVWDAERQSKLIESITLGLPIPIIFLAEDQNGRLEIVDGSQRIRTAKYRPKFPSTGFADLATARTWAAHFVHWYNHEHRHSGIRYVSPTQRHAGQDDKILAARHALYVQARERNPRRWSCNTRDWSQIDMVTLNPECEIAVPTGIKPGAENQRLAA